MFELDATTVIAQGSRTASRVVSGAAVVVVIDTQELHTLNEVGTRVWQLAERRPLGEIAKAISEEFEVTYETALDDVRAFTETLLSGGMVDVVASP